MDLTATVSQTIEDMIIVTENANDDTDVSNESSQISSESNTNENEDILPRSNEPTLIQINQINTNITYLWKIQAFVTCEYPKRTFANMHGMGEISSWDLTDQSASITLVAFNFNSCMMADKLKKNIAYEFTNLTIRSAIDAYKTLPHLFQLVCTNATHVREIDAPFDVRHIVYNFTHLNQIDTIPLNSIIDIHVRVIRDFGISTGMKNDNIWSRRDIRLEQDNIHISMTLWNDQARLFERNMAGLRIKFKNVKVSWYDGLRVLISIGNTHIAQMRN